jgi:membrane-bound lytic murein transglycosylase B
VQGLKSSAAAALTAVLLCAGSAPAAAVNVRRPEVRHFIADMSARYGFNKRRLAKLLKRAQSQPAIIEAMGRPAEKAKLWYEYRAIFVNEKRIREGAEFWLAHREELDRASAATGVAPEYLVAILGVETSYGRLTGHYRVLDALTTLAFDYPARSKFFTEELEQFLLLTRESGVDPLKAMGSYAGAMGAPQFMPSNYRRYAVDASADGRIDLWSNWPDVFASVGNYFAQFGWVSGEAVLDEASVDPAAAPALDGRTLGLTDTVGSLRAKGLSFESSLPADAPALLIAADEPDGVHWRVGYRNFFVITRYNHSALYAMAVYDLAAAVRQRVTQPDAAPADAAAVSAAAVATPVAGAAATAGAAAAASEAPSAAAPGANGAVAPNAGAAQPVPP